MTRKTRPPFWAKEIRPDKIKRNCRIGRHVPAKIEGDYVVVILCQNCGKELSFADYWKFWGKP